MLRKIVSIKNVGRFRNSAAPGNPQLSRYTLVLGANGIGKTTLCAILRSLQTGKSAYITGRQTLGVEEAPTVEFLFPDGPARFDDTGWSAPNPHLAIFDGVFVAENVHSGEVVEVVHRRNLYHVIIGAEGVRLAEEDERLAKLSRGKTSEITAAGEAIQPYIPAGIALDAFLDLLADPAIDARIAEQERTVEAIRQAQEINDRLPLSEITVPSLPDRLSALLAQTIDDIAQDAEIRVAEHLAAHGMEAEGGSWIAERLEHADGESCPFCGQDIRGLPLITAYRAVFSDRHKELCNEIEAMRKQVFEQFGDGAIGVLNTRAERNKGAVEFWSRFCAFDPTPLTMSGDIPRAISALRQAALALLDRKGQAPLEPIRPDAAFDSAATTYAAVQDMSQGMTEAIRAVNALIDAKKNESGEANAQAAERQLARYRAIKDRHSERVAGLCAVRARLIAKKDAIERCKQEVRQQLNAHTRGIARPYERRINHHLDAFNSGFRIAETQHHYPAGIAASTYRLVINNTAIDLGDGRTPPDLPSFKNTLSSGDRTTLALAFFFTHLEQDRDVAAKTVVFDDPFSSQDAFRRRQTVHEITRVGQSCAQVIVLSHDATFLKQVWDKTPPAERVSLTLANHGVHGTKITNVDLENACQGRTASDLDDLQTYRNTGAGRPRDVIRKMRGVLETHCWTTYPAYFRPREDWLGEIVRKIRAGGDQHPAHDLYDELDQINDYTSQYHHGEDIAHPMPDEIDPQELTGYVKRTLRVVNALQA